MATRFGWLQPLLGCAAFHDVLPPPVRSKWPSCAVPSPLLVQFLHVLSAPAKAQGQRLGRRPRWVSDDDLGRVAHLSTRKAAAQLGLPSSVLHRARVSRKPIEAVV